MNLLSGITDKPKQTTAIALGDGSTATLVLEYRPQQLGWFFNLSRESFALNGCRVAASPNLIRSWRKLLPFGLAVLTSGGEPLAQDAFASGAAKVYLLDADEVEEVEAAVFVGF